MPSTGGPLKRPFCARVTTSTSSTSLARFCFLQRPFPLRTPFLLSNFGRVGFLVGSGGGFLSFFFGNGGGFLVRRTTGFFLPPWREFFRPRSRCFRLEISSANVFFLIGGT